MLIKLAGALFIALACEIGFAQNTRINQPPIGGATLPISLTTGVAGILPSANGGTGIAYFTATGPTVARVYTFPDAAATILYSGGALGTPASGVGTNLTGTAAGLTAGTVTTNANLTGPVTSSGNATTLKVAHCVAASDETTNLSTGTAKVTFRMPYAMTLTEVRGSVSTVATGATLLQFDVNEAGSTIFSTEPTFDASESTTVTAATPAVISDSALADDALMTVDIVAVGNTTTGKGLKVCLIGTRS